MSLAPLVSLMDDLARETWRRLELSHALGMPRGENTITDGHLLAIAELVSTASVPIRVIPITQNAERRLGADFEFWLRLDEGRYFGYSIQAKKVSKGVRHLTYPQLSESGFPPAQFQYDTLLDHAARYGSIAVHVLYNGWPLDSGALHDEKSDPLLYGCAAIYTSRLKRLRESARRNSNRADIFAGSSMPWSYLFRVPPEYPTQTDVPEPPGGNELEAPAISPTIKDVTAIIRSITREEWGNQIPRLQSELPEYVQKAIEQQRGQLPDKPALPRFVVVIDNRKAWTE